MHQWISGSVAMHNIGSYSHLSSFLAHAFVAATWPNSKCFKSEETRHWKGVAHQMTNCPEIFFVFSVAERLSLEK